MRNRGAALVLFLGCVALAADALFAPAPTRPQVQRRTARPPGKPSAGTPPDVYGAMPDAERIAIQLDGAKAAVVRVICVRE